METSYYFNETNATIAALLVANLNHEEIAKHLNLTVTEVQDRIDAILDIFGSNIEIPDIC